MYRRIKDQRKKIRNRIRSKVSGTPDQPRLSVFRSNKHIYVQLIDDTVGKTLCFASENELKNPKGLKKAERAYKVGGLLAQKALKLKMKKIVFDRGGYDYHGRVKAVAQGSRQRGLEF